MSKLQNSTRDANSAISACAVTKRLTVSPTRRRRKVVEKDLLPLMKNSNQLGCAFQEMEPPKRKSMLRKGTQFLGPKRSVHFSKGTHATSKFGKEWVHPRVFFSVLNLMSVGPNALKFEDRSQEETLQQEGCGRRDCMGNSEKMSTSSKKMDKATFHSISEVWSLPAPPSTKIEEREFVVDSRASMHMLSRERSELRGTGHCSSIQKPFNGYHSQWRSANERGSNSVHLRP